MIFLAEVTVLPKKKQNLNTVYISERLRETLRPISGRALTAVTAPMGYGKTTAVNWYLAERIKEESPYVIRISVYSDNLAVFWKSVVSAFSSAGFKFLSDFPCPVDAAGGGMLIDAVCHELGGGKSCYIFIDDFHLFKDSRVTSFLCTAASRIPENVHLIVASRDSFLPEAEILRLGKRLYTISSERLCLNLTELSAFAGKCGAELSESQLDFLFKSSEGWFSAVYLNLQMLSEKGELPRRSSDIYSVFTAAMLDPLSEEEREFTAVMGIADEFTADMARFVTGDGNAEGLLSSLTGKNAFVKRLSDGVTYRFHNIMRECAKRTFSAFEKERQKSFLDRYGEWYEKCGYFLHAMHFYNQSENYDAELRVIRKDAGILLSSLNPDDVLAFIEKCPVQALKRHPAAVLVLMRCMFNRRQIPKMLELKELFMSALAENSEMSQDERGNLLGECDLIMSFLEYNDIGAMSRLHRSASGLMSRPAISIHKSGGWTFGSPSVLMMFHREAGSLEKELAEMDECMPYYYRITDGHGRGAEKIMRAEALFMQGRFADAQIELYCAYAAIEGNGQENMALCCDFLAWRMHISTDFEPRCTIEEKYSELVEHHNVAWVNILNTAAAYCYAVLGVTDKIPKAFKEHNLGSVNILAPGRPMAELAENRVYLAQGAYAKAIGQNERQAAICEKMHYGLVALHLLIQSAASYAMLGRSDKAAKLLRQALCNAAPDGFVMPFVENYRFIKPLLNAVTAEDNSEFIKKIIRFGEEAEHRRNRLRESKCRPPYLAVLTEREYAIVNYVAEHLSNREIAEKLFLTEGSVKQYINRIYSKLEIDGDAHTKRKRLKELTKG